MGIKRKAIIRILRDRIKPIQKVELEEYNSYNTHRLSEVELKELLAQIDVK